MVPWRGGGIILVFIGATVCDENEWQAGKIQNLITWTLDAWQRVLLGAAAAFSAWFRDGVSVGSIVFRICVMHGLCKWVLPEATAPSDSEGRCATDR